MRYNHNTIYGVHIYKQVNISLDQKTFAKAIINILSDVEYP
jgi:hypothetical protein